MKIKFRVKISKYGGCFRVPTLESYNFQLVRLMGIMAIWTCRGYVCLEIHRLSWPESHRKRKLRRREVGWSGWFPRQAGRQPLRAGTQLARAQPRGTRGSPREAKRPGVWPNGQSCEAKRPVVLAHAGKPADGQTACRFGPTPVLVPGLRKFCF